jgi:hypothetical protein
VARYPALTHFRDLDLSFPRPGHSQTGCADARQPLVQWGNMLKQAYRPVLCEQNVSVVETVVDLEKHLARKP